MGGNDECCSQHANLTATLKEINGKLDTVIVRLAHGDTSIATIEQRIKTLEMIVFPAVALICLSVLGGLIALVVIKG